MTKQTNIKKWLGALQTAFIVLSVGLALLPSSAEAILCGTYRCDAPRRCVARDGCVEYRTANSAAGAITSCVEYGKIYSCIGENEKKPKNATEVKVSTNSDGRELSGQEEADALSGAAKAKYTNFEEREIVNNYYADVEQISISEGAEKLFKKARETEEDDEGLFAQNDMKKAKKALDDLVEYANSTKGYYKGLRGVGDNNYEDKVQQAEDRLRDVYEDGYITEEEYNRLKSEIERISQTVYDRQIKAAQLAENKYKEESAREAMADIREEYIQRCPTIAQYRARYGAGCWSCLVLEKLISAFLHAAQKGLHITQEAGVILLIIGSGLWFVFWALKNVSSFTEIQLGNILNDLLKFIFKVMFAYWFIMSGPTAINKYLITPIMSVGAVIAQNFWAPEIREYVEGWDTITDEDTAALQKELQKDTSQISTDIPAEDSMSRELTAEEKAYDEEISSQNEEIFGQMDIPNLLIPGVSGGYVTSLFGCRPRPCDGCSKTHKGIDAVATGKPCSPILAAGPGTIRYQVQRKESGKVSGYGYYAIIDHGQISGNTWKTYYAHMTMGSGGAEGTSRQVKQGEKIGCMGNTGVGTGAHLHFGVYFMGKVNNKSINGYVDPLSLPAGKICTIEDSNCDGRNRKICDSSLITQNPPKGQTIQTGGWPAAGQAIGLLTSASDYSSSSGYEGDGGALILDIPEVKYTGPTDIMPKSVMNSLLGAMRVITDTVSEIKVMGNMIICFSDIEGGGKWHFKIVGTDVYIINLIMWVEGAIIWCLGFMLVMAVAYYFLDISFKIGFAVLAIPLVMGLWPFGMTKDKLFIAISIIAKSSAMFAFMALTTYFGIELLNSALNLGGFEGEDGLYAAFDQIVDRRIETGSDEMEELAGILNEKLSLFSGSFILLAFAVIYTYKLVQKTSSDLVNKFFPDKAFGDSSPMHSGATMMTDLAKKIAGSGPALARDIVTHQAGKLVKGGITKTVKGTANAVFHPVKSARAVRDKVKETTAKAKHVKDRFSDIISRRGN